MKRYGAETMGHLDTMNLKTVQRLGRDDPEQARRRKLAAALTEQLNVLKAARSGGQYHVPVRRWETNDEGERVALHTEKRVRPWFFEQDGGWYVQCRYGSRVLSLNGKSNAVFVDKLDDVASALDALHAATMSGELDIAISEALKSVPRGRKAGSKTQVSGSVSKH